MAMTITAIRVKLGKKIWYNSSLLAENISKLHRYLEVRSNPFIMFLPMMARLDMVSAASEIAK
jgi:hypothetical protein